MFLNVGIEPDNQAAFIHLTDLVRLPRQEAMGLDAKLAVQCKGPCNSLSKLSCTHNQAMALIESLFAHEPQPFPEGHARKAKNRQVQHPKIQEHEPRIVELTHEI